MQPIRVYIYVGPDLTPQRVVRVVITTDRKWRYFHGATAADPWVMRRSELPSFTDAEWWGPPDPPEHWRELPAGEVQP